MQEVRRSGVSGERFLTLNAVVRVNQIEVTRERMVGVDESEFHTPETVAELRNAFAKGWPEGRMTWAFSWRALLDERPNYVAIREQVAGYHEQYGDDVTFFSGGFFPNAYDTRDNVSRDLHDGLALAAEIVGPGYRPTSIIAGFLAAENQRFLAEQEGVHVCQGNIWSQYAIDNQDGDGSICYPYYPSREHFCKPAQGSADFIDCVNLDGWTCDFLAARREGFKAGFNSRMGVGPIETVGAYGPEIGVRQMMATTAAHFDEGFALNNFGWVTALWETSLVRTMGHIEALTHWCEQIRQRWPEAKCATIGEFGEAWRQQFPTNDNLNYRFVQRGSGIGGSDANMEIRWFMNKSFRLALLRDWQANGPTYVIDFTRYDLSGHEPTELTRRWSLLGQINQKQTRPQDRPVPLSELPKADQYIIFGHYPELARS